MRVRNGENRVSEKGGIKGKEHKKQGEKENENSVPINFAPTFKAFLKR